MVYNNAGWLVESVAAECTSGDSESWDVFIIYRHEDGRWVQEAYTFTLMGEVLVNGERFGFEPFLDSVDDNYAEAMLHADTLDPDMGGDRVERRYFFMAHSEMRYAGWGDLDLGTDYPDPVESDPGIEPGDLDTYDGPASLIDLDHAVTAHLGAWADRWAATGLRFNDMDDMHESLTDS